GLSQNQSFRRLILRNACCRLASRRFCTAALEGLVALRGFSGRSALTSSSTSLPSASSLLRSWLRVSWLIICTRPSACNRLDRRFRKRAFSTSENTVAESMSKSSVTLVSTLLTCCPPAPPLRDVWKCTKGSNESVSIFLICIIRVQPKHRHPNSIYSRRMRTALPTWPPHYRPSH